MTKTKITKIISFMLAIITVMSCFSCFASAASYKFPYHKDPSTIEKGEYGYGMANFDVDDNYKCIFYTTGSLKETIHYGSAGMKILAPLIYPFEVILIKFAVKVCERKFPDYDIIQLSNDDYYYGYIGEGNFIY